MNRRRGKKDRVNLFLNCYKIKKVFNCFLKTGNDDIDLILSGKSFHCLGPALCFQFHPPYFRKGQLFKFKRCYSWIFTQLYKLLISHDPAPQLKTFWYPQRPKWFVPEYGLAPSQWTSSLLLLNMICLFCIFHDFLFCFVLRFFTLHVYTCISVS